MIAPVAAEWSPHRAMWLGFPSHAELWEGDLAPAQDETAALARTLAGPGKERVRLFVRGDAAEEAAMARLDGVAGVEIVRGLFGDIWLRDTGPVFLARDGAFAAAGFRFNGWGGKYVLDGDEQVAEQIGRRRRRSASASEDLSAGGRGHRERRPGHGARNSPASA